MKKKLSNEELITFCGQMALILKSGISSLEGIYIMEDGDAQTEGKEILKEIREELEMCGMLYPAMEKTGVFPEYALHMTEIGEQTGRLDETMEALAAYYQREEETLDAVKSAVTYPVAMLGMLLMIVAVLFIKVMPVFEQVYMQLGQEMTGVARQLLNIGDWMRQSAIVLVVLAVVILIITCFVIFYKKVRIKFISKIQTIGFMKKIAWKRARKYHRVQQACLFTMAASFCFLSVILTACWFNAETLIRLFRDDPEVTAVALPAFRYQCFAMLLQPVIVAGNMLFQSIGKSGRATFLACCRQGVFFIPLILTLPRAFGLLGVEICQPIADVLTFFVTVPFLFPFLRQLVRMDEAEAAMA